MSEDMILLQDIRNEPDDDTLRLVYADWLEDHGDPARAEFIRVQIDSERHPRFSSSPEYERLTGRAIELLLEHGSKWSRGYDPEIPPDAVLSAHRPEFANQGGIMLLKGIRTANGTSWRELYSALWFRRGFVEVIELNLERLTSFDVTAIHPTGPLPIVRNMWSESANVLIPFLERLNAVPLNGRIGGIAISTGFGATSDEDLRALARQTVILKHLCGLTLHEEHVSDQAVLPLLEYPTSTRFRELALDDTWCTSAIVDLLLRSDRFRDMVSLNLTRVIDGGRGLRLFGTPGRWPRLRGLSLAHCGLDDLTLRGLMRPGAFPALEVFALEYNDVHYSAVRNFLLSGSAPRLEKLGLGRTPLTPEEVQALRREFGERIHFPEPRRRRS